MLMRETSETATNVNKMVIQFKIISEFYHLIKCDSIHIMLVYNLLLCICVPQHSTRSGTGKKKERKDNVQ